MVEVRPRKTIRSYRSVFRRRWRIFRIQGWRIPLPGGLELRLLAYWLGALALLGVLARLPLLDRPLAAAPAPLRFAALPLAAAWLLSRWEVDGRSPHRALLGLAGWLLRPRTVAALRRVPPPGTDLAPLATVLCAPDLGAARYPAGRIRGPARVLLRYPLRAELRRSRLPPGHAASTLILRPAPGPPLHRGRVLDVAAGTSAVFEPPR